MKLCAKVLSALFITLVFNSCKQNPLDVDVSKVDVPAVKFNRLDKELFSLNPQNVAARKIEMEKTYGFFYYKYLSGILKLPHPDSVLLFVNNSDIQQVHSEVEKTFSNDFIAKLESDLTLSMKRFKHHFPDHTLPLNFATYISGFDHKVYVDTTFGISLEMYLGTENNFYKQLQWPRYQVRQLTKEFMLVDAVKGWMIAEFNQEEPVEKLLNYMIAYGKILYATDALLPDTHDSLKICYTTKQMAYCKEFEKNIWGFFAQENRLYENSRKNIMDFTSEGPFTGAISKDCPPQIAYWVGWQIVRSYMKNNEDVSLAELMKEQDVQKILAKSKYRP